MHITRRLSAEPGGTSRARILAQVLADDFIRPRVYTEMQALELALFERTVG